MSSLSIEDLREAIGGFRREVRGFARRMLITLGDGPVWQTLGHTLFDGSEPETRQPEVFSGIGFYARPEEGSQTAEAIVFNVGGSNNPVIIASKDEALRALVDDIAPGEACAFNRAGRVYLRNDGTIEIRSHANPATQKTLLGQTYRAAEDTLLTALGVFATAIGSLNPATAPGAATTLNAAITTFKNAAATYLTAVAKVQ